jgi:hypothetical protein
MRYFSTLFVGFFLLFHTDFASAQAKASKAFLLEDAGNNQWCSYLTEATWKAKVQEVGAMMVGTLIYSNDHLSQIDVTETDESGDWTVYDHYFFDDHGEIVKLTRLLNVLPGDRSVSQTFSISNGKAEKTATSEKQLSDGKPVTTPAGDWVPDVAIRTESRMFPFAALVSRPGVRSSPRSCVKISASQ